jgi:tRNA (cmo5U34)-methyltransferase
VGVTGAQQARRPGAAWQQAEQATAFIGLRRRLIPLFDAQEALTRRLVVRSRREVKRFCDLGAGDGGFAELLMEEFPRSTGVLVDFSEPMLAAAKERLDDKRERWRIVRGDLSTPAWTGGLSQGERFDAVVSRLSIHHLPDERKRALYGEVHDLLEPGGFFLNWEHVSTGGLAEGLFEEYFVEQLVAAEQAREHPRQPDEVRRAYLDAQDDDILAPAEDQCEWLRRLGFEDVEVYFKLPELAIFGGVKPPGDAGVGAGGRKEAK